MPVGICGGQVTVRNRVPPGAQPAWPALDPCEQSDPADHQQSARRLADACTGADVIYTDVWVSMGEPDEVWAERIKLLEPYRVTEEVMAMASKDAIFLHCLPSFHDTNTTTGADIAERFGVTEMEVTDGVFESKQSKAFDEAENRMHTIKAVMYATLS